MRFFERYSSLTVLVASLGLSLLMMSSGDNPLSSALQSMFRPLQHGIASLVEGSSDVWHHYVDLTHIEQRHEEALTELSVLRREVVALQESRIERDRLRALLGFQQKLGRPAIAARVIGWDSSHFAESILCNRGTDDGVEVNMCVSTSDGLVGRVLRTSANTCQVQLALDELSNVAAMVQRTRVPGIITGQGADKPLLMRYVPKSADIAINDPIIASGIDGIYHKGLLIGYVSQVDIDSSSLFQKVLVQPSVDMQRVEEVLIFVAEQIEPELEVEVAEEATPTAEATPVAATPAATEATPKKTPTPKPVPE